MGMIEQISDEEIKEALIQANGQPTKAAEILDMSYPHLYTRIRKNPALYEVQKAYRARTFQTVSNIAFNTFLTGIMQEPETDEDGNVIEGQFRKIKVDHRTRLSLVPNLMQTFKSDEGIKDQMEVTTSGSINIADWLKLNNQAKTEE